MMLLDAMISLRLGGRDLFQNRKCLSATVVGIPDPGPNPDSM